MGRLALAGRIVLTVLLAVLLVGFGACGVLGITVGIQDRGSAVVIVLGLLGLAIAVFIAFVVASIWRKRGVPPA
jgi:hypothetical protein